jgi:hypothetical protein
LQSALQHPAVLRSRIYELFTAKLLHHEAQKGSVAGSFSTEEVEREAKAYSERLAMETMDNVTEISAAHSSSALFRGPSAWGKFLRAPICFESLRLAAIPMRQIGDTLGFLHKVRFLLRLGEGASGLVTIWMKCACLRELFFAGQSDCRIIVMYR